MVEQSIQVEAALTAVAVRRGVPHVSGLDDLAELLRGIVGVVDVDHEDVAPGGAAALAEQILQPVAAETHEHAVRRRRQPAAVALDECDVPVVTPGIRRLPVDDPLNLVGGVRGFGEVLLAARLAVVGARVEDVGHQRRLARVVTTGARRHQEERLAVAVGDLLHAVEDVEVLRGDVVAPGDVDDDARRHALTFGVLQPLLVVAVRGRPGEKAGIPQRLLVFVLGLRAGIVALARLWRELLLAEFVVLGADPADPAGDRAKVAIGFGDDLAELTETLLHDRQEHLFAVLARGYGRRGVDHPLAHRIEVAPARVDHLRRLVHLRAESLIEPCEPAEDVTVVGVGGAVGACGTADPLRTGGRRLHVRLHGAQRGALVVPSAGFGSAFTEG